MHKSTLTSLILTFIYFTSPLFAQYEIDTPNVEVNGRLDLAPAYVHIDVLDSGHTIKRMDLLAIRAEGLLMLYKGLCLKPIVLYGSNRGSIFTAGSGLGFVFPIQDQWFVTPLIGVTYGHLHTTIDLPAFGLYDLTEKFRSVSAYLGLDVTYKLSSCMRVCASYQYVYSWTHTTITDLNSSTNSRPKGSNYGLMFERDFYDYWSVQVGGAYNESLTKEKHGLRAYGFKLGIARWF